jgi:hypothetical protein
MLGNARFVPETPAFAMCHAALGRAYAVTLAHRRPTSVLSINLEAHEYCTVGQYGTLDVVSNASITKIFEDQNSDFVTVKSSFSFLYGDEVRILIFDDPAEDN